MALMFRSVLQNSGGAITLTVTCSPPFAGLTISCTDGVTTLTKTCPATSPYEVVFDIPNSGTWTLSGEISGETYTEVVVIPSTAILNATPNGKTVIPTDVISTLLHCAAIWDKNYTLISELLADTTTLLAVLSDNNAVDYLARSETWASDVSSDSTAMTYIGAINYAANTLLDANTWRTAICNSTYFESVLNVKVPTMTSNTTPSGVASASSAYNNNMQAWKAFNGTYVNGDDCWHSAEGQGNNSWLRYQFTESVRIHKLTMRNRNNTSYVYPPASFVVQGSTNGSTWTSLTGSLAKTGGNIVEDTYILPVFSDTYNNYQVKISTGSAVVAISVLQFYGRKDV